MRYQNNWQSPEYPQLSLEILYQTYKSKKVTFKNCVGKHFEFCGGRQSTLLNHSRTKPRQQGKQQHHRITASNIFNVFPHAHVFGQHHFLHLPEVLLEYLSPVLILLEICYISIISHLTNPVWNTNLCFCLISKFSWTKKVWKVICWS